MDRWLAKLISLILTFVLPFIFTVLPHHMKGYMDRQGSRGKRILCLLMCFGGGIFLATYLLHMGPEVRDILDEALLEPNHITYPLPDFIIGCGFFCVLFVEKLVMRLSKRRDQRRKKRHVKKCSMYQISSIDGRFVEISCSDDKRCDQNVGVSPFGDAKNEPTRQTELVADSNCLSYDNIACCASDSVEFTNSDDGVDIARAAGSAVDVRPYASLDVLPESANNNTTTSSAGDEGDGGDDQGTYRTVRSLILILALSLHHFFEGISVGLQRSVSGVFTLLIALLCHETIISFSLGLQFVKSSYSRRLHYITAFVCSIIEPIGVAVGMTMSEVGEPSTAMGVVDGVLQSFATGTFIYVTFFEILQTEIDPRDTSIGKVTSALAGFMVMSLLIMIPVDSSSDDEPSGVATVVDMFSNYTTVPVRT